MAKTPTMSSLNVECQAAPGVDPAAAASLCAALVGVLQDRFPGQTVAVADPATPPLVRLDLFALGAGGADLQLGWQVPDAAAETGPRRSLSVTDTSPSVAMLTAFLGRLVDATPFPF
jgi:hypothetical protein